MEQTIANLPDYLRRYVIDQPQSSYTARDHAAWRFIMRQSRAFFNQHALPIYLEGLKKTGITTESIPRISDMDRKLRSLGWGAVPVRGFIPPAAFLDFQARRILPIAADMRTVDHIGYTPAPDIVHEAAGHAPILADSEYSEYLTKYAAMAQKAMFAKEDLNLYEAIRTLSDVKENPDSTPHCVADAQTKLDKAVAAIEFISEANKTARMNWWTVEYGLLGDLKHPLIYGAGLLSSVRESQACLSENVKKIPLTVACTETSYDITEPQPQLFVAESIPHLCSVLDEFDQSLSYRRGGIYGLEQARECATITTTVLDSGLQISGQLLEMIAEGETVHFAKWTGPVQLATDDQQLPDHGVNQHPQGFSSPLGRWRAAPTRNPKDFSDADLRAQGIVTGGKYRLEFVSGFSVEGEIVQLVRKHGSLVSIKWRNSFVKRGAEVYFEPSWGEFDMAIGCDVQSVFGGPADRDAYGSHEVGEATTSPARQSPFSSRELELFATYAQLREFRQDIANLSNNPSIADQVRQTIDAVHRQYPDEWLLRLECLELAHLLAKTFQNGEAYLQDIKRRLLDDRSRFTPDVQDLIDQGITLAVSDT